MNIFVKPKEGINIRRPDTGAYLAAEGEEVPKNTFWARRVLDGDVEVVEQAQDEHKDGVEKHAAKSKGGFLNKVLHGGDQ